MPEVLEEVVGSSAAVERYSSQVVACQFAEAIFVEQIVVVMFLSRYPWEDTTGVPVQVMLRAQKGKLLEAQRAGGAGLAAALDAAIQVEQF